MMKKKNFKYYLLLLEKLKVLASSRKFLSVRLKFDSILKVL